MMDFELCVADTQPAVSTGKDYSTGYFVIQEGQFIYHN